MAVSARHLPIGRRRTSLKPTTAIDTGIASCSGWDRRKGSDTSPHTKGIIRRLPMTGDLWRPLRRTTPPSVDPRNPLNVGVALKADGRRPSPCDETTGAGPSIDRHLNHRSATRRSAASTSRGSTSTFTGTERNTTVCGHLWDITNQTEVIPQVCIWLVIYCCDERLLYYCSVVGS